MKSRILGCSLSTIWASTKRLSSHCSCSKVYSPACYIVQKRRICDFKACDNIAEMLQEDTKAVRIEPILQPLTGQEQSISGNVSLEACCKVFWSKCPMPWKQNTQKMLWIEWTQEEKRLQLQDFECSKRLISNPCFLDNKQYEKRLCQMILLKLKEELSVVTYRIRCKISYTLLQSSLLRVRGSHRRSRYDCLFKKDKQDSL